MRGIIKYIIFILIILAIIFLSQQPYFQEKGKIMYQKVAGWGSVVKNWCQDFFQKNIFSRISSEIEKRQEIAKQELENQSKEIGQNIWQRIENYFLGLLGLKKQ